MKSTNPQEEQTAESVEVQRLVLLSQQISAVTGEDVPSDEEGIRSYASQFRNMCEDQLMQVDDLIWETLDDEEENSQSSVNE